MASASLSDLIPAARAAVEALIARADSVGITTRVVSTLRTCAEQRQLYAQGRTAPGNVVTYADGCRSWHVWGRAADLLVVNDDGSIAPGSDSRYDTLGSIAKSVGLGWGGNFPGFRDAGHFEYRGGHSITEVCPDPDRCEELVEGQEPAPISQQVRSVAQGGGIGRWMWILGAAAVAYAAWKGR